jgi:Clp amino terminal domain, pathogenicity island component
MVLALARKEADRLNHHSVGTTKDVKKALAYASIEARELNHSYIGTEHILLGLLRAGEGVAARFFQRHEIDAGPVRNEILRELDPAFVPPNEAATPAPHAAPARPDPPRRNRTFWYFTPPSIPGCIVSPATESPFRWWDSEWF